ncbi:hypothetical protein MSAS_35180 [Mycobacterium saskatchewanense]|uniref:Uncharacterized protein n=1 Tax=Mycobacterium saskatchewanense TaxID=220927 RepID=A0AAJ3NPD4_9MYCO|nr:hypothetical protein AWC23_16675 [Mycobacterium saskatchewanense]BBX64344.1 hypothetical protein MSAS_35180 [Mycobacterium saskatchewanense]
MATTRKSSGGGSAEDMLAVLLDFLSHFAALTASRRGRPTDDLASAIATTFVGGVKHLPIRYTLR